jgi:tRNA (mo5U34)-methyltransferase
MEFRDLAPDAFDRGDVVTIRGQLQPRPAPEELRSLVRALAPWFHNLDLSGIQTAPDHFLGDHPAQKWRRIEHVLPSRLDGLSVLDVGCNAGFFSIELKRRGAARVLGIDTEARYLAQAALAAVVAGVEIELQLLSVYDVDRAIGQFDLVLFMGVLYHLRYPLLALDTLARHVVRDVIIVQSLLRGSEDVSAFDDDYSFDEVTIFDQPGYPKLHFVEGSYAGDATNWWIPNAACVQAMIRSAGFGILQQPAEDVFVCEPAGGGSGVLARYAQLVEEVC